MLLPPGLRIPGRLCLTPQPACYALLGRLPWPLQSTTPMPLNAMSQDFGGVLTCTSLGTLKTVFMAALAWWWP